MATILESVKIACNVPLSETVFDADLLLNINGVISFAQRIGVNGLENLDVDENTEYPTFTEGDGKEVQRLMKLYIPLKVKASWDPSTSASIGSAQNDRVRELEESLLLACSEDLE